MKKSLQLLVVLFAVLSAASCSADEAYDTSENSFHLNDPGGTGSNNDDRDWDKNQIINPGEGNNP